MGNLINYRFIQDFSTNISEVNNVKNEIVENSSGAVSDVSSASGSTSETKKQANTEFSKWLNVEYVSTFQASGASGASGTSTSSSNSSRFHYETSLKKKDVNNWDAMQKAIKDMGLRETYCRGVYCQQHNPEMPAGSYANQRHYVWNDATQEMVELPDIYFISADGNQAKNLEGYEEILAYAQGFRFTETDGVYTKDGKNYTFNVKTLEFEEIAEEPKNPVDTVLDKYLTDEYDTTMNAKDAAPILIEILQELTPVLQSEYGMTTEEITELFQNEVNNNLMCRIGSNETCINISVFVENLKRAIENFVENNKTGLDKLWDKYLTDEYDKEVSFDTLSPFLAELKATLMSEEYNYTEEQYNELIQKALIQCPKDMTNISGMISIKLNFKELVSIIKDLIENPEEPEKSPVDKILDKYATDGYDKDVAGIEAVTVITEILNELTPVLESEYNMSKDDIQKLAQEALKASSKPNLVTGSSINIRTFVNTLRELIVNFEHQEEPVDNRTDLEKFLDRIETDEFDYTTSKEEALSYINELRDLLMAEFSEKRGYSEEYSNFMFDFIVKEMHLDNELNLKDVLKNFYNMTKTLTSYARTACSLQVISSINSSTSDSIINYILAMAQKIIPQELQTKEYLSTLFKKLDIFMTGLNSGNDNSWLDELYDVLKEYVKQPNYNNATTIDADNLFRNTDSLTIEDLYKTNFIVSEDAGLMKFGDYIANAFDKIKVYNRYDSQDLFRSIIVLLNKKADVQNTVPVTLQRETIERLNEQDIFSIIEEIIESDELKQEYYCGVDGNIDDFGQGSTGDCWLLGGLISLSANEYGRQAIKDAINIEDNGNIKVKLYNFIELKWVTYEITPEELEFARKAPAYSYGDNDVLVMELAIEKLYKDMFKGKGDGTPGSAIYGGAESGLIEIVTGKNCPWVRNEDLEKLYPLVNNGDVVLTMDLSKGVSATTVDGEVFNWTAGDHAFGIVEMTEDTITMVNPWHSDIKYTFTFEEFKKLNPSVWAAKMTDGKSENLNYDKISSSSFKIEGKEYTIESLLNSEKNTRSNFVPVVRGTQHWNEGYFDTTDAINTIKTFIQTFANNLTNYDDYFMVQDAIQATINYYGHAGMIGNNDSFEYYNNSIGEHETSYDQSCVVKSANYNDIQNGSVFEGKTSDTGIYSAYDAENDTWYVQIDYQKVLEKFLSFLR